MSDANQTLRSAPAARRPFRLPDEIGVVAALVLMMVVIGVVKPRFLNPINLFTILGNTTFQGMLSLGMVFLLAIREIDLSVGWMFNFSAVVSALLMVAGVDPWLAMRDRHRVRRPARAGQRAAGGAAAAAVDHRDAGHLLDVRRPVAGDQQRTGRSIRPTRIPASSR